jgi:hypothetical protein
VRNASALRFPGGFGLRLSRGGHESDQRVTDGALHGVLGGSVKSDAVDYRSNHDPALHELANGLANVLVIATKAINPAHDERIALAEEIEEPAALRSLGKLGGDAEDAFVRK